MIKKLTYTLSDNKGRFACVLLFGLGLNAIVTAADPLIMRLLIDEGLIRKNFHLFAVFATAVVVFAIGLRGLSLAYELLSQKVKNEISRSLTLRMHKSYFAIPYTDIAKSDSGYFISRIYDEPLKIARGIVTTFIGLLISVITLAVGLLISLYLTWKITLILSLVVPALYYLSSRFSPKIKSASEQENEQEARLREALGKSVDCYKTVKIFGLYPSVHRYVLGRLQSYLAVLYSRAKTTQSYQALGGMWLSLAEVLVLVAAGWEVVSGNLSIGGLFAFMSAFWKVIGAAAGMVSQVPELLTLSGCVDRLTEFESMAQPARIRESDGIELDRVSFRYSARNILEGFNFAIGAGERVVIVGPNGSGKTTLGLLMTGFLEPSEGIVRTPALERISAMLTPFYFAPGSLKDNVSYSELTEQKREAFWKLVRSLGLESRIDADASSELSEGEKKKCQIVMTLLKDADIYLFDEPLASVDVGSRDVIIQTQLEHTRGKTVISIMHGDEHYHSLFDRVVSLKHTAAVAVCQ
jgi:ABC-type bacteriocin/lantibiotic exporter with double-glycine peptidase domain